MSWEDQGRQDHGWFGNGTASTGGGSGANSTDTTFDPARMTARIDAVAHASLASMVGSDRRHFSANFDRQRQNQLRTAMAAWIGARSVSQTEFADRLVDPSTSDTAVGKLRAAAEGAETATSHQDLAQASAALAGAMQSIGLSKWPRFLADAAARAEMHETGNKPIVLAQLATPNKANDTAPGSGPNPDTKRAEFQKKFAAATAAAYQKYSHDCSHYLQEFLKNTGAPDTTYRTANAFMIFVQQKDSGWKSVTAEEAVTLSASGHIVMAGLAQPNGSGHVAVVGPQTMPSPLVAGHPMSPQVFSGSMGRWPGARSQGQHTVADSWSGPERSKVTYWVKQ